MLNTHDAVELKALNNIKKAIKKKKGPITWKEARIAISATHHAIDAVFYNARINNWIEYGQLKYLEDAEGDGKITC